MTSQPRLVATDLDGTVVRGDGTISARTRAAFARARRAGARVVAVTGRPPRLVGEVAAAFGHRGTAVCSNGALVCDMGSGRITEEHLIPVDELAMAAKCLRELAPDIGLAVEYAGTVASDCRYEADGWDSGVVLSRVPDEELLARPAPKLLGRHPTLSADDLLALAAPALDGVVNVYHANGTRLVEVVAAGVSKGAALADLAARDGTAPADVVAFGDMLNDLPMLGWAGRSYAVANAHPDVLAAADEVIPGVEDDGVATVLEHLFPAP